MATVAGMYAMQPLADPNLKPVLPADIYPMASLNIASKGVLTTTAGSAGAASSTSGLPRAWAALEQRQTAVLDKLAQLEKDIAKHLPADAGKAGAPAAAASGHEDLPPAKRPPPSSMAMQPAYPNDLTVSCASAPLASLIVASMAKDDVFVRSFWHSSMGTPTAAFVENVRRQPVRKTKTRISLLISKVEQPTLVVSPSQTAPIQGDSNIARLLCRLHRPELLGGNDIVLSTQVDQWIEAAEGLQGSAKDTKKVLKDANAQLGKEPFLCGKTMTLADICLVAYAQSQSGALPSNIKELVKKLESHLEAARAL
eukprot:m.183126 g.183126  ORF g.183126 m.183126 type:complete len:312 (+) comp17468_c0_seq1:174-1109(+)